jgi:hypothetical protein
MSAYWDRRSLSGGGSYLGSQDADSPGVAGVVTLARMPNGSGTPPEVSALAINVAVPEELQWTDTRRDVEYRLQTLNIRLLPDGSLAAKAYGRPVAGGRAATRRSGCRSRRN